MSREITDTWEKSGVVQKAPTVSEDTRVLSARFVIIKMVSSGNRVSVTSAPPSG